MREKISSVLSDFHRACPGWNHNWPATGEGEKPFPAIPSDSLRESEGMAGSRGNAVIRQQVSCRSAGTGPAEAGGGTKSSEWQIPRLFFPRYQEVL